MNSRELKQALESAGFREKFAIENGAESVKEMNGHKLYIFRYSDSIEYQDANGATYDATKKAWIN